MYILVRDKQRNFETDTDTKIWKQHDLRGRNRSDQGPRQGKPRMTVASRSWERQRADSPIESSEVTHPRSHLFFRPLASRSVRDHTYNVFNT